MNLVCLYYNTAFKPKMKAGWFISGSSFLSGRPLDTSYRHPQAYLLGASKSSQLDNEN